MTPLRCRCGSPISHAPIGRPPSRCKTCAGARARRLDRERHARRPSFKDRINWEHFMVALCTRTRLHGITPEKAAERAKVPLVSVERAMAGKSISPVYFGRLCDWIRWPRNVFNRKPGPA